MQFKERVEKLLNLQDFDEFIINIFLLFNSLSWVHSHAM